MTDVVLAEFLKPYLFFEIRLFLFEPFSFLVAFVFYDRGDFFPGRSLVKGFAHHGGYLCGLDGLIGNGHPAGPNPRVLESPVS
jgi:hypothetical protein